MKSMRWYMQYARHFRWRLTGAGLLYVLTGAVVIGTTSIQKWVIDDVFFNDRFDLLPILLLLLAIGAILSNGFHAIAGLMMHANNLRLKQKLTNTYKQVLTKIPTSRFLSTRTGDYTHTFINELPQVAGLVTHYIPNLIRYLVQVAILACIIFWASPGLLLALSIFSIAFIVLGKKSIPKIKQITKDKQELHASYTVQLEEGISSTREVIAFHRLKWEQKRLDHAFKAYFQKVIEEMKWKNVQLFLTEPLKWLPSLIVLGYGGYAVMKQDMTLGMFIIVFQFAQQYMESMSAGYHHVIGFSQELTMVERVHGKFQAGDELFEKDLVLDEPIRTIGFSQIGFTYGEGLPHILQQVTVDLPIGKKIAIVGESGCGKSTLARLLVKYYRPVKGEIMVNGMSLARIVSSSWYDRLAYVPQDPYLLPDTIEANIRFGRDHISDEELKRACELAQISTWIESLPEGYDTLCGERGIQLSGGQRQRVAVARAILEKKELLILDEATSALDQDTERILQQQLDVIRQEQEMTTIVIAHRLSTIINADVIMVLDQGHVIDMGTHEELLNRCPLYFQLVDNYLDIAN